MKKAPIEITLDCGETVTVSPLLWRDSLTAIRLVAGSLVTFSAQKDNPGFSGDRLADLIVGSEELLTFLLETSTGRSREWVDNLSFADAFPIVEKIIELNVTKLTLESFQKMSASMMKIAAAQTRTANN